MTAASYRPAHGGRPGVVLLDEREVGMAEVMRAFELGDGWLERAVEVDRDVRRLLQPHALEAFEAALDRCVLGGDA